MKAAVYRRYGSPGVVSVDEVPRPVPRDDEVLVRIHAATLGVVDSLARRGAPFYARTHFGLRRPRSPTRRHCASCGTRRTFSPGRPS